MSKVKVGLVQMSKDQKLNEKKSRGIEKWKGLQLQKNKELDEK